MVLVYFALAGCVTGALFGTPSAYLIRLARLSWRRWLYFVAVAASIAPYALHYHHSLQHLVRSGVEEYSGLNQYAFAVPVTAASAILCAVAIAWFRPALAALLPVVFGGLYWYFLVPLLYRETPASFVGLDNVPFVWLFAFSVAGCVFLLLIAAIALGFRAPDGTGNPAGSRGEQAAARDARACGGVKS